MKKYFQYIDGTFRKAVFEKYGIRECYVKLTPISEHEGMPPKIGKKKVLSTPKVGSVRSLVSWVPKKFTTRRNSVAALAALFEYQSQGTTLKALKTSVAAKEDAAKNSADDSQAEFLDKFGQNNRSLKPANERQLSQAQPGPVPLWKKIFDEFQSKR